MPKARRDDLSPDQLRNTVAALFDDADLQRILKFGARYGMSKSAAVRYLTRMALDAEDRKARRTTRKSPKE